MPNRQPEVTEPERSSHPTLSPDVVSFLTELAASRTPGAALGALDVVRDRLGEEASTIAPLIEAIVSRVGECFRLQNLAGKDELTGIANRRTFAEALDREVARHVRHGGGVSVILLDLDNLKQLNDTGGHARGDEALIKSAQACQEALRASDLVARLGGDEFAVLLPETEIAAARLVAARLRESIQAQSVGEDKLRVSVGYASSENLQVTSTNLLSTADSLLYEDKRERKANLAFEAA